MKIVIAVLPESATNSFFDTLKLEAERPSHFSCVTNLLFYNEKYNFTT